MPLRKIIHIDMDCFYAAVEMRDNPRLKSKPIAIGGPPGTRSVLCTANYEARKFGVRAAMTSNQAVKLCPNLEIVPPHFDKYRKVSREIHTIFKEYTSLIEPLSLDEAYLDVTESKSHQGSATLIAREIQQKIFEKTSLTASAGVAPNKFIAKIASDINKPNGIFIVSPSEVDDFVKELPLKKIPGVGSVTLGKMNNLGLHTCSDIRQKGENFCHLHFKNFGKRLFDLAHGKDHSQVVHEFDRKSLSVEHTLKDDIDDSDEIQSLSESVIEELEKRVINHLSKFPLDIHCIQKLYAKIKLHNFQSHTFESIKDSSYFEGIDHSGLRPEIKEELSSMVETLYQKERLPLRLIGVGFKFKRKAQDKGQLSFL